ncbi:MAG TPA: GNAT family N-acetyltransferase [Burkholderiaceae bacterium]|nr:GNAT family N-acetyltransferase [Burkholderiaceae bacterium]
MTPGGYAAAALPSAMFDPASLPANLRWSTDGSMVRFEEASLNAAQPAEQVLYDGWLVRFSSGKAKRARSINAIAPGRVPLAEKLAQCAFWYGQAQLPLLVRITPFSQPPDLDEQLARAGFAAFEDTRVMAAPLDRIPTVADRQLVTRAVDAVQFARLIGTLRASPAEHIESHARRMSLSPLVAQRLVAFEDEAPVAAGQVIYDADGLAGLYDIVTAPQYRGRGLGGRLTRLLLQAARAHARTAYLQVEATNAPARRIYEQLGFVDQYAYWYRCAVHAQP